MTPDVKMLVAGNWKMHGTQQSLADLDAIETATRVDFNALDIQLHVPATLISRAATRSNALVIGAQDCHAAPNGAHTGDISVEMLKDAGARSVIVGHSERRTDHGETDADIRAKAKSVIGGGLQAIICIGETRAEREVGQASDVVLQQLSASVPDVATATNTVIAYEPVWAIGTGLTASSDDIRDIHTIIRGALSQRFGDGHAFRILYGGSVKPANAAEIFSVNNVDGGLIGGASLKADDFLAICSAAAGQ